MVFNVLILISVVSIVWIAVLTVVVRRMINHYNRLVRGQSGLTLQSMLEHVLNDQEKQGRVIQTLNERIHTIATEGISHHQRIGVSRYNPFADTGGAQSFSMAILDGKNDGIVMTSLYARTGNRWYVKEIIGGKGKSIDLSKEEQTAVKIAFDSKER